ncbi:hypothetical protein QVD17_00137 [Tagetes erecta]|uniref:HhH-GPD domain-containing protein n=1 Tax=Tagetes erecta TaxID=13708 RepID=A0AAD8L9K2_TARER|nr:hypothetical protein QVD17_00137 [Tagetes erecta]
MMEMEMEMEMAVSKTFELEKAVCNHGFFMMAPNTWIPSTKTLVRPLRLPDNSSVTVYISQSRPNFITITATCRDVHQHIIMDQVRRMLRLSKEEDEAIKEFHSLHAEAANKGFGRLFRNPTLFEDIVKTWLLCACRFKDSLEMAETLCTQQKRKRGMRKRECKFPTPQEVCTFDRNKLKKRLGYRGDRILDLALDVTSGKINLERFDSYSNGDDLYTELKKIKGVGDFVSCNILMRTSKGPRFNTAAEAESKGLGTLHSKLMNVKSGLSGLLGSTKK